MKSVLATYPRLQAAHDRAERLRGSESGDQDPAAGSSYRTRLWADAVGETLNVWLATDDLAGEHLKIDPPNYRKLPGLPLTQLRVTSEQPPKVRAQAAKFDAKHHARTDMARVAITELSQDHLCSQPRGRRPRSPTASPRRASPSPPPRRAASKEEAFHRMLTEVRRGRYIEPQEKLLGPRRYAQRAARAVEVSEAKKVWRLDDSAWKKRGNWADSVRPRTNRQATPYLTLSRRRRAPLAALTPWPHPLAAGHVCRHD